MKLSESIDLELPHVDPEQIKPGAIWEISRRVQSPLKLDREEQQSLYPDAAQNFLTGNSPPRYVMIVNEPEPALDPEEEWRIVCVMLLSVKTDRLSDVDILIPSQVSGVGQDLIAETWNVLPMLTCNLSHFVGRRLSRQVYDILLDVGDYYNGLIDEPPTIQEIQLLGLQIGAVSAKQQPEIQAFHQQESDWAAILQVPVAAYRTYIKTMKVTEAIFDTALQLEREFCEVEITPAHQDLSLNVITSDREAISTNETDSDRCVPMAMTTDTVHLNQWFQNIFETGWQTLEELLGKPAANKAVSFKHFILDPILSPCGFLDGGDDIDFLYDGGDDTACYDCRAGNDVLYGGVGDDVLYGDDDNDVLDTEAGNDFDPGNKNDDLYGHNWADYLYGGEGNDQLTGESGDDVLTGSAADDLIFGDNDLLYGEAGNDVLDTEAGNDYGYNKNDSIYGQDGVDYLDGGEGNDQFNGEFGDDWLYGEAGNHVLDTEAGNDFGADNKNDSIYGQDGVDYLDGGEGNDQFNGESGDDSLHGEEFHVGIIDTTGIVDTGIINTDYSLEEIIAALIIQLSDNENELQRQQAIKKLGEIGTGNSDAITALTEILSTTQDKVILWTAAESLWQIDPDNPAAGIRRAKLIDLGKQPNGETVMLTLALIQKPDRNVEILVQLYPTGDKDYLPPDLKLILLEESGKTRFEVTARLEDACIQLNFSGLPNQHFGIRIALEDTSITHFFVI